MPRLNKQNPLPLYQQLAQYLRAQIRQGDYAFGEQLPTERHLMQKYDVSRNTVRQALDQLAHEGLLERDQGRGTFVSNPRLKLGMLRLTSFTEDMQERNMRPSSRTLARRIEAPPLEISRQLQLLPGETALYLERLRFADEIPMALNSSYFNFHLFPDLVNDDLEDCSIYSIIENRYHHPLVRADQTIRTASATNNEADLLKIPHHTPLLIVEGIIFGQDETPVEYLRSVYRSDRYEFMIHSVRTI